MNEDLQDYRIESCPGLRELRLEYNMRFSRIMEENEFFKEQKRIMRNKEDDMIRDLLTCDMCGSKIEDRRGD